VVCGEEGKERERKKRKRESRLEEII